MTGYWSIESEPVSAWPIIRVGVQNEALDSALAG